jgi:hypothetical protein
VVYASDLDSLDRMAGLIDDVDFEKGGIVLLRLGRGVAAGIEKPGETESNDKYESFHRTSS